MQAGVLLLCLGEYVFAALTPAVPMLTSPETIPYRTAVT